MNNIGKTLFDIGHMDALAAGSSPLHRLDPRILLLTTLAFIVTVISFDRYALAQLTPFCVYPVILIVLGDLPARYILRKVLVMSPLAVLIGIGNPLMDRMIVGHIGSLAISGGWLSFASIILRFALTVSAALCLVSLAGFNAVCESLWRLGLPRPFVVQLLFLYRYLFVLTDEAERMVRARSFRALAAGAIGYRTFISLIGHLLLRALDRAERIYRAMCCRGFDGHIRMARRLAIRSREIVFVGGWVIAFIVLRYADLPGRVGLFLTGGAR